MINFKKYTNRLVRDLFSIIPEENEDIRELLNFSPDIETYRIFLEEYLCFKIAMAYQILSDTNILTCNDSVHTEAELADCLINEAVSVINNEIIQIPDFFRKPEVADGDDAYAQPVSRDLMIKRKFRDRWEMYVSGRGLYLHYLFSSKFPASIKDRIDDNKLYNIIYGSYHLVEDRINRVSAFEETKKEETIVRQVFPNMGKFGEFIIAVIIYFLIPIMIVKWFNASKPVSVREMYGIICSVCSSVYLLHYGERMSDSQESTGSNLQWLKECMFIGFLVLIGILIVK